MRKPRLKLPTRQQKPRPRPRARAASRRVFKVSSRAVLIAVISVAAAMILAAVVPLLVPTSAYQRWVEERVLGHAGAGVSMEKFRFQLLPYPGYTIEGMEFVSKSAPFQGQPFLRVEKARGSISFLSLVGGRIVTAIAASGVTVDYRSFGGQSNLGALMGLAQGSEVVPSAIGSTVVGAGEIGAQASPPAPTPQAPAALPAELKALPMPSVEGTPVGPSAPPAGENSPGAETGRPGPRTIAPPPGPAPGVQSPLPPSSGLMKGLILRSAFAEELSEDEEASLEITSISVSNGRINFWEGGAIDFAIDDVALSAGNLSFSGGLGAEVRMRGKAISRALPENESDGGFSSLSASPAAAPASASLALSGRAFVDGKRREFGLRGARLSVGNSQMSAELSFGYGQAPISFDIHVATPGASPRDASPVLELMGFPMPSGLSWQGPVSADVSAKGTREAFDLGLRIDGEQARFSFSEIFTKGAGLPFKVDLSMAVSPTSVHLKEGSVMLGQEGFKVAGELSRGEWSSIKFSAVGQGLGLGGLKLFFPALSIIDEMEEFDLSVDAQGPLYAGSVPAITGQVKGKSVSIAGVEVEDFEAAFERAGSSAAPAAGALPAPQSAQDFQVPGQGAPPPEVKAGAFSVPSLKGSYAGGRLSGNGSFGFGPPFSIDFDAVVSDFDASSLPELGGQVSGQAALVVKLSGAGQDAQSLSGSTKLSGSLLVSEGKWRDVRVGAQLFTPDLWRAVEEAAGVKLDASEEARLSGADDPIKDAKVSFDSSAGRTALSEMSWSQGGMEIRGTGEIAAGELKGEGEAALAKEAALRLASTPAARKALVGSGEKIVVPVKIAGKPSAPEFHADVAKFAAAVRERASVAAAAAPAKKALAPKPSAAPSQPAPAKEKGRAVAPAPAPFKPPPPPTEEQVDDILKVIIGH